MFQHMIIQENIAQLFHYNNTLVSVRNFSMSVKPLEHVSITPLLTRSHLNHTKFSQFIPPGPHTACINCYKACKSALCSSTQSEQPVYTTVKKYSSLLNKSSFIASYCSWLLHTYTKCHTIPHSRFLVIEKCPVDACCAWSQYK